MRAVFGVDSGPFVSSSLSSAADGAAGGTSGLLANSDRLNPQNNYNSYFLNESGERAIPGKYERTPQECSSGIRSVLGKLWNGVNSGIGLVWGLIGTPFGATMTTGNNAIQFEDHPFTFSAITLGNTISYSSKMGPDSTSAESKEFTVGDHERQHTYQGELLGPLYLPSNLLGGLIALLFQGSWHGSLNWNERGPQSSPPKPW